MSDLPRGIKQSIRRYETIEAEGLSLYPVLVKEYDEFLLARPALEVMHQSLPVAMMRIPLLSALYQMDFEAALNGKPLTGLFSRTLIALALSLRLGEGKDVKERVNAFQIAVDRNDPQKLMALHFTDANGVEKTILPERYAQIRKIIAAQNGVRIESDRANPALVEARKKMASATSVTLDENTDDLISAVAALCRCEEAEIEEWPILKLQNRSNAYRRIIDYMIDGIGEMSGASWKDGNPNPHPFFARLETGGGLLSAIGKTDAGKAEDARNAQKILNITKNL